ncbi:hypothetical protein [Flagellimonas sp.]|uniref:hypothetical protein n=1 Tax=Flagellimonas sp. TaxID=2058762 RepID=UPI003C7BD11C
MSDQVTAKSAISQKRLKKIVKKHRTKELLTPESVRKMRDTPLNLKTFIRNARRFYAINQIGTRLVLSHPFTDVNGRYLKTVVLDFSKFEKDGYIHVQPFSPANNDYGVTQTEFNFWLSVKSHRELYYKLLKHGLL